MPLFLACAEAQADLIRQELLCRVYLTDGLRALLATVSGLWGGGAMGARYYDLLRPQAPEPDKSGEEIARDVLARAGIQVI